MRKLTLTREKAYAASLAKLKVYIEDQFGEMQINGTNCHLLGKIKSGETCEYEIGENTAKLYVIADSLSKEYCNDFYQIPAGSEDVVLSGKCKLNPARGNAFTFNGNEDNPEVMQARKKNSKKGIIILVLAIVIGALIGVVVGFVIGGGINCTKRAVNSLVPKEKTFSKDGISIVLTDKFSEESMSPYNLVLTSELNQAGVFILKEPFNLQLGLGSKTIDEYTKLVQASNGRGGATIYTDGDARYFEYEIYPEGSSELYHYRVYTFKGKDAFWIVNFACPAKRAEKLTPSIEQWARSVTFY